MAGGAVASPLHAPSNEAATGKQRGQARKHRVDKDKEEDETQLWAQEIFQLRGQNKASQHSSSSDTKNQRLGFASLVLLFVLGVCAGLLNGGILAANAALCKIQAQLLIIGGARQTPTLGLLYFVLIMVVLAFSAAVACKYGARAAAGSGLPEFKYLLGSEMGMQGYEALISLRILVFKIIGLILSVGGGLSVGSEGPLVHTAACVAYFLLKNIPDFTEILDSPSITKQIFAASAAVGVSSAFNAPVGGLLFSIEVTSTFYLVATYWRSFIAAMSGAVACNLLLATKDGGVNSAPLLVLQMSDNEKTQYAKWELGVFAVMGFLFGWLAHGYLLMHKHISRFMRPYNRDHPLLVAVCAAVFTSLVVYGTGQYSASSVGVVSLVSDVFNKGKVVEMTTVSYMADSAMEGLLLAFACRWVLTLVGTNILVPAGIFMPVTLIGGLLGRFVGHVVYGCGYVDVYIPGYALVGACAFAAGITHTVSVAVIVVEMTGDIKMLLPCLVVSVIAAGITKAHGVSVYDIGMINKGLETFQLLLLERDGTHRNAGSIMDEAVVMVPQSCTVLSLVKNLELTSQQTFPLIDDAAKKEPRLIASMQRADVYKYLLAVFTSRGLLPVLQSMLPHDAAENERVEALRLRSLQLRTERARYKKMLVNAIFSGSGSSAKADLGGGRRGDNSSGGKGGGGRAGGRRQVGTAVGNPLHNPPPPAAASAALLPGPGTGTDDDDTDDGPLTVDTGPAHSGLVTIIESPPNAPPRSRGYEHLEQLSPGESGKSTRSADTPDSSFVWDAINNATQTFIRGVEGIHSSLGLSPTTPKGGDLESGLGTPFSFDPLDPGILALFATVVEPEREKAFALNLFPFSVHERAPMEQLYILFEMVKMSTIFVVNSGHLRGMISRDRLLHSLRRKAN